MRSAWLAVVLAVPLGLVVQACSGSGDAPTQAPAHGTIAFVRGRQVVLMKPDGSRLRTLARGPGVVGPTWSPNGAKLAFTTRTRLFVVNADGSRLRTLARGPGVGGPTWSANGAKLAFSMNSGGPLFVVNADGSGLHRVSGPKLEKYESDLDPVWSPNGQQLVFDGRGDGWTAIFVVHVDGSGERKLAGGPSSRGDPGVFGGNAWSPDGRKIAFTDRHGVAVISPDGSGRRRLTRRASVLWSGASWSPDGRELAFAGSEAIWVVRANGTGLRRLVSATAAGLDVGSTGGLGLPVWSPDGRTLAFDTRKRLVYVINRDGSGLRSVGSRAKLFWWSQGLSEVEWSPDGRELVFTSYPDSDDNGDIDVVNADGSGERWLTRSKLDECCAVWSPVG